MSNWEFLILTVRYGNDDRVKSVRRNGRKIFSDVDQSVLARFMNSLESEGWELAKVTPEEWGEIRELKRRRE